MARRGARARANKTLSPRVLRRELRASGGPVQLELWMPRRPRTRAECRDGPRPCPWVSCRYHLALDVKEGGGLTFNFPALEVWQLRQTCALDVAERGGLPLAEVGEVLNVSDERVRQIVAAAVARMAIGLG